MYIASAKTENITDILCFLKNTKITVSTKNMNVSPVIVSMLILISIAFLPANGNEEILTALPRTGKTLI